MTTQPKHAPRAPRVPFALLVASLLIGGLILLLALNTFSAANELQRNSLADKDAVVAARVADLRNEVAASAAPANLSAAAAQLGMVPAGHPAFLVVGPDGVVHVMGKPKPVRDAPLAIPAAHAKKKPAKPTKTPAKTGKAAKPAKPAKTTSSRTTKPGTTAKPGRTASTSKSAKASKSATPTSTPKPTPTPTPVVTLPGGTR